MPSITEDHIRWVLHQYHLALPDDDVPALLAKVQADHELIRALLGEPLPPEMLPVLQPEWAPAAAGSPFDAPAIVSPAAPDELAAESPTVPHTTGHGDVGTTHTPGAAGAGNMTQASERSPLTPTEAVEQALAAIAAHPGAAAFTEVLAEQARAEAHRLEQAFGRGAERPPLWGTTFAVKDLIQVAGRRLTGGSLALDTAVAQQDAAVVTALRRAGAVLIGVNTLHELAFGTTGENPHYGTAQNPAAPGRMPGGSSSGSAAAVGFAMATFSIGTDTGGSIRIPAACCGVVGFKPSFDLVPRSGTFPLGYTLDHLGPLTRSVTDAARVLDALTGRPGAYTGQLQRPLRGVRLGVPTDYFQTAAPDVHAIYEQVLQAAQEAGAQLVPVPLPHFRLAPAVYLATSGPEALAIHYPTLAQRGERLGTDVRVRLAAALWIPAAARVRAQQWRRRLHEDLAAAFRQADALLTPTLPVAPPPLGTHQVTLDGQAVPTTLAFLRHTCPFNLTGVPSISIPAGRTDTGAPVGLQVTGPYGMDRHVLQIAWALEATLA